MIGDYGERHTGKDVAEVAYGLEDSVPFSFRDGPSALFVVQRVGVIPKHLISIRVLLRKHGS